MQDFTACLNLLFYDARMVTVEIIEIDQELIWNRTNEAVNRMHY